MASDYRERGGEVAAAPPAPQPKRDIFAGLQLRRPAGPVEQAKAIPEPPLRGRFNGLRIRAHAIERASAPDPVDRAIQRYGRAAQDIAAMQDKGLNPLIHQNDAMTKAARELDAVRADGARDLGTAMAKHPGLIAEAAGGSIQRAVSAMRAERELRIDTQARTDRFVTEWQGGMKQLQQHKRAHDHAGAERIGKQLGDMAKGLHRDPQLESLLQNRRAQLGLDVMSKKPLSQDLQQWLSPSRSLGLGL